MQSALDARSCGDAFHDANLQAHSLEVGLLAAPGLYLIIKKQGATQ